MIIQNQENVLPWLLQCMNAEGQPTNQTSQQVDQIRIQEKDSVLLGLWAPEKKKWCPIFAFGQS